MALPNAAKSGTFSIGGDLKVNRLGFGAMRITGQGIWGPPADRAEAIRTLKRLRDLGVDFIDTAEAYGPYVSEELIKEALYPYGDLVIATKGGLQRSGPDIWYMNGRPDVLRRGRLVGCVTNHSFSGGGIRLPTGTVSESVERTNVGGKP